ncbi:MAG: DUF3795 domain-containing protein [Deltaproteobacteria bacterium]|nr:DUF3795 domain-containing protein [Deltaproteobacteria bacterium]
MIACCGLDCLQCGAYQATQADDDEKRALVAKEWSERYGVDVKPEQINCDGCLSDGKKFYYCSDLCEIRACCVQKELAHCAVCDMYACDKLEGFFQLAPEARKALDKLHS